MPTGSGLGPTGGLLASYPWQPLEGTSRQNYKFRGKRSFSLPILVQQPRRFCLDQNQQGAPHPCSWQPVTPHLRVLKGER